jgi:uncharacterized membrane protein
MVDRVTVITTPTTTDIRDIMVGSMWAVVTIAAVIITIITTMAATSSTAVPPSMAAARADFAARPFRLAVAMSAAGAEAEAVTPGVVVAAATAVVEVVAVTTRPFFNRSIACPHSRAGTTLNRNTLSVF